MKTNRITFKFPPPGPFSARELTLHDASGPELSVVIQDGHQPAAVLDISIEQEEVLYRFLRARRKVRRRAMGQ